jgi:hypothetical protein
MGSVKGSLLLEPGDKIALGFTARSLAPVGKSSVPGITEQLIDASLDTFQLEVGSITKAPGTLYADLFRARSPDDGRPTGASLGQVSFKTKGFKTVKAYVYNSKKKKKMPLPKGKAWGWWKGNKDYELIVSPPKKSTKLNIAPLKAKIQPGYSYTLVLQVAGGTGLSIGSSTIPDADGSGVARAVSGSGWSESALALNRSLEGVATVTQASAKTVVERVKITIQGTDKKKITGYASIASQAMIDESWLGAVAGEVAP